jgi:polynucleotide 5'-kinase involved in rRNA processing
MAFTGSVSPEGHLDTFLDAASRITQAARQMACRLLIDTTGLVDGELGYTVKRRKVERLKPDLIIALQRERELEELLAALPSFPVERLTPPSGCLRRSLAERAAYRDRQFARYFVNAVKQTLSLRRTRLVGLEPEWATRTIPLSLAALMDRVVGLRNAQGEDLALGLIRDIDTQHGTLTVFTPLRDISSITTIAVGSVRWPVTKSESLAQEGFLQE